MQPHVIVNSTRQSYARACVLGALVLLFELAGVSDARAQGVGFSGGMAFDPTQVYAGALFESQPLVDRFHIRPGIDGAFGNDLQLAIIDVAFLYKFPVGPLSPWEVYQGTGPVVTIERAHAQRSAHGGIGAVFGVVHRNGFFFEFKVASGGAPSLRLGIGYMIRPMKRP